MDLAEMLASAKEQGFKEGRAEAYRELAPLLEDVVTMDNICDAIGGSDWCEANCGKTDKCLEKYVNDLKERKNDRG